MHARARVAVMRSRPQRMLLPVLHKVRYCMRLACILHMHDSRRPPDFSIGSRNPDRSWVQNSPCVITTQGCAHARTHART